MTVLRSPMLCMLQSNSNYSHYNKLKTEIVALLPKCSSSRAGRHSRVGAAWSLTEVTTFRGQLGRCSRKEHARQVYKGLPRASADSQPRAGSVSTGCSPADVVEGCWSVVIPTYNRLPILNKCLQALEGQRLSAEHGLSEYEVVVVDDGSTDGTVEALSGVEGAMPFSKVKLFKQQHAGATEARNLGIRKAKGSVIVFIDSDMVVTDTFLSSHAKALHESRRNAEDDSAFSYGRVVNTANFEEPTSEPFKLTDYSAAFFATGNVAIPRSRLLNCGISLEHGGPFDALFSEYGWEDLELGERLRQRGARIVQCPQAVGFHYHPAFTLEQLPARLDQEAQRGRNAVKFFRLHPNLNVRLMCQLTWFHQGLWQLLTLFGLVNEHSLRPVLKYLVAHGKAEVAEALLSPVYNSHYMRAMEQVVP